MKRRNASIFVVLFAAAFAAPLMAGERAFVGMAPQGARIEASIVPGPSASAATVVLVGGWNGEDESSGIVREEVRAFEALKQAQRRFQLIAIPVANPEKSRLEFPPKGVAYRENPESHALWRWTALHAADLVIAVGAEDFGFSRELP